MSRSFESGFPGSVRLAGVIMTGALALGACSGDGSDSEARRTTSTLETSTTLEEVETTIAEESCIDVIQTSNDGHKLVDEGIDSIGTAVTEEDARKAAADVLGVVGSDPETLAGYAAVWLKKDVEPSTLYSDDKKCLSEDGEVLLNELTGAFITAKITPEDAPADGINSGINENGEFVQSANAGIDGNRKAIKVELEDGTIAWIMQRCANPVVMNPTPGIPKGPTDQPPKAPPATPITSKRDDGELPGDGTDASQDPGTPDVAGEGDGNSPVNPDGTIEGEGPLPTQPQQVVPTPTTRPISTDTTPTPTTAVTPPSSAPTQVTTPPTVTVPRP